MNQSQSIQARTTEEKEALLLEWQSSGISKKAFCSQKSINYQTFIWWLGRRKASSNKKQSFLPLITDKVQNGLQVEIHLSNSRRIIISGAVSAEIIQAVLRC